MNYEATCLALANKSKLDPKNSHKVDIKAYSHMGYKNLQMAGKRTANASVNISNNSQTSTSKDLKSQKAKKKANLASSVVISPHKKVTHIDQNKKTLCDYQQAKRSPPEPNNLVIVVNDKPDKNDNLLAKYLRKEAKIKTKQVQSKPKIAHKPKVIEFPSPANKNSFTIESSSKGAKVDNLDSFVPGKEQKLNALQNMPIKKFIVANNEGSYRGKVQEKEKKLDFTGLSPQNIVKKTKVDPSKTSTKIASEHYRIGKVLGKGAFGKVNLAIHKESGDLVAMKSLNKQYLSESSSHSKVMQEVAILKMIKHENIM